METASTSARRQDIDRLRGMAVVMMFFIHSATAWLDPQYSSGGYYEWVLWLGGLVAPTFLTLAGLSAVLAARKQGDPRALDKRAPLSKRGLQITALGIGLALSFFTLSGFKAPLDRLWRADILPCIGLSLAVLPWVAWPLGGRFRKWIGLALFCALPLVALGLAWLRVESILPAALGAQASVRAGNGSFPLIPFAGWIALGFFLGAVFPVQQQALWAEKRFFVTLILAAGLFYAAYLGLAWAFHRYEVFAPGGVRPVRGMLHSFLHKAALVFVLMVVVRLSLAVVPVRGASVLSLFGRTSLFAYCAHLLLIYHFGGQLLQKKLSALGVFLCAVALTAAMFGLCVLWARRRRWLLLARART
ncbi:MAG: DUF1624 domain-containing protein [Myxococcota bacterium]|jgi:uncharacterized membrane protein|nr:DUF1624 domain-containing protein [Myxococcota bacterium]